jgi:hypothetical protein
MDPLLIPDEKIIFIPEPNARIPGNALYLEADEAVLNKLPGLRYPVQIKIIEIQDWSTLPPLSDEEGRIPDDDDDGDSDDSNFNRCHPGFD